MSRMYSKQKTIAEIVHNYVNSSNITKIRYSFVSQCYFSPTTVLPSIFFLEQTLNRGFRLKAPYSGPFCWLGGIKERESSTSI